MPMALGEGTVIASSTVGTPLSGSSSLADAVILSKDDCVMSSSGLLSGASVKCVSSEGIYTPVADFTSGTWLSTAGRELFGSRMGTPALLACLLVWKALILDCTTFSNFCTVCTSFFVMRDDWSDCEEGLRSSWWSSRCSLSVTFCVGKTDKASWSFGNFEELKLLFKSSSCASLSFSAISLAFASLSGILFCDWGASGSGRIFPVINTFPSFDTALLLSDFETSPAGSFCRSFSMGLFSFGIFRSTQDFRRPFTSTLILAGGRCSTALVGSFFWNRLFRFSESSFLFKFVISSLTALARVKVFSCELPPLEVSLPGRSLASRNVW